MIKNIIKILICIFVLTNKNSAQCITQTKYPDRVPEAEMQGRVSVLMPVVLPSSGFYVMPKLFTQEDFLLKAKLIHGDRYDYSMAFYDGVDKDVIIICRKHGKFYQTPYRHINRKHGCRKCSEEKSSINLSFTTEQFLERAKKIHGNKYDYSLVRYINSHKKIKIICNKHGIFEQSPYHHLNSHGCEKCGFIKSGINQRLGVAGFKKCAIEVHGYKYIYDKVKYVDNKTSVEIICPKHGSFYQRPDSHLNGRGCSLCNVKSKGEEKIKLFLNSFNIKSINNYYISDRVFGSHLFDFYIQSKNVLIEYNGIQHYKPVKFFGGELALKKRQLKDKDKSFIAEKLGIKLIVIPYWEKNIEQIIRDHLLVSNAR